MLVSESMMFPEPLGSPIAIIENEYYIHRILRAILLINPKVRALQIIRWNCLRLQVCTKVETRDARLKQRPQHPFVKLGGVTLTALAAGRVVQSVVQGMISRGDHQRID